MSKTKLFTGLLLIAAVLFAQVGTVFAAPQAQDTTPITGTIQSITLETDTNGVTTVVVTVMDDMGGTQTLRLSVDTAVVLGLVTLDTTTGEPVVDEAQVGETVEIDPTTVIPEEETAEESYSIIAEILGSFFSEDPSVIDGYHEDGFGFGVIAQSLWISQNLGGDASLTGDILQAKQDKDFETFFETHPEYLAEGESAPTNWGQFKKALSDKKNNLGTVVSGHGNNPNDESLTTDQTQPGNGNGNGHGNGNNNGKENKGKGKGKNK